MSNTNISKRGYSILKEDHSSAYLNDVRRDLTVKPFINSGYGLYSHEPGNALLVFSVNGD